MYALPCKLVLIILVSSQTIISSVIEPATQYGQDLSGMQLELYAKNNPNIPQYRRGDGVPIYDTSNTRRASEVGPITIGDMNLLEVLMHFDQERIAERAIFARGAGASGYFDSTCDLSKYSQAALFKVGKRTPIFARFSQEIGNVGTPDTLPGVKGFSIKFYTNEGIWDLITINMPVYFIRDPMRFTSLIHSKRNNPITGLPDKAAFWDFHSLLPETLPGLIYLFSDSAVPASYSNLETHSVNSYGLTLPDGNYSAVKYHLIPNDGTACMTTEEAIRLAGRDPFYYSRDLYNKIAGGKYLTWNLTAEIISRKNLEILGWKAAFDSTKLWPENLVEFVPLGVITLNQNPSNYFSEVEQVAFSPSRMVPGMEPSLDPLVEARLLAYPDAQNYRLGINNQLIPVNRPITSVANIDRDGNARTDRNQGGAPNYLPTSFHGPQGNIRFRRIPYPVNGLVQPYNSTDYDNYSLPSKLWSKLSEADRAKISKNIADDLIFAPKFIQDRAINNFNQASTDWGSRVASYIESTTTTA